MRQFQFYNSYIIDGSKMDKGRFVKNWRADAYYKSVREVPLEAYFDKGFKLLLVDIDNTLAVHGLSESQDFAKEQLARFRQIGFKVIVLSNARLPRAKSFASSLDPLLEVFGDARKPSTKGIDEAILSTSFSRDETLFLGDQVFTDVWAGKRAKIKMVLVDPISYDEPWYIKLKRIGERIIKKWHQTEEYYDTIL